MNGKNHFIILLLLSIYACAFKMPDGAEKVDLYYGHFLLQSWPENKRTLNIEVDTSLPPDTLFFKASGLKGGLTQTTLEIQNMAGNKTDRIPRIRLAGDGTTAVFAYPLTKEAMDKLKDLHFKIVLDNHQYNTPRNTYNSGGIYQQNLTALAPSLHDFGFRQIITPMKKNVLSFILSSSLMIFGLLSAKADELDRVIVYVNNKLAGTWRANENQVVHIHGIADGDTLTFKAATDLGGLGNSSIDIKDNNGVPVENIESPTSGEGSATFVYVIKLKKIDTGKVSSLQVFLNVDPARNLPTTLVALISLRKTNE